MQSLQLQNDTLIDIATFLVRRWSGKENVTVEFSKVRQNVTRLKEKRVLLMPMSIIMEMIFRNTDSLESRFGMKQCD